MGVRRGPILHAKAIRSGAFSFTNNVVTAVDLDAEITDPSGLHDNVTNPSRILLPRPGLWLLQGAISYAGAASGERQARIEVSGALQHYTVQTAYTGTQVVAVSGVYVASGSSDYVILAGYQNSGGSLGISNLGTSYGTWLSATYLGK